MALNNNVVTILRAGIDELKADLAKGLGHFKTFGERVPKTIPADPFKQLKAEIADASTTIGATLGGLALGGAALTKSFVDRSVEMQQFRGTLTAVTKDVAVADAQLRKMVDFAARTPFDLPGVVGAGVQLASLNQNVDRFLPLAGELAAVFKRDIKDAALALGKSLAGSQDGLTQLADSFGISKAEMIKFGAAAKADGSISTAAEDLDKLRDALEKIIKSKYGGAMEAQSATAAGAFSNLGDSIGQLQAQLGDALADDFAKIAKSVTSVVESFQELPEPTKNMVARSIVLGTAAAGVTAGLAGIAAAAGPLLAAFATVSSVGAAVTGVLGTLASGLFLTEGAISAAAGAAVAGSSGMAALTGSAAAAGTAAAGAGTGFAGLAGILGAAVVPVLVVATAAFAYYIHRMGEANKAAEELQIEQQKVADHFRESRTAIVEAADALKQYHGNVAAAASATADAFRRDGKTDLDAAKAILALNEQRNKAWEDGDKDRAKILSERIAVMYGVREQLSGTHAEQMAAEKKAADASKAALEAQARAEQDYQKRSSAGYYETKKAQLDALDSILAGAKRGSKEREALELSRVKLAREVAKESLDADLHRIDVAKKAGELSARQEIALLQQILKAKGVALKAEEKQRIEGEIAAAQGKVKADNEKRWEEATKKGAETAKKAQEAGKKAAEENFDLRQRALETDRDGKKTIEEKLEIEKQLVDLEAQKALYSERNAKNRQAILDNAKAEKDLLDKQAADAIAKRDADLATKRADLARDTAAEEEAAQTAGFEKRRRQLDEEEARGRNVRAERLKLEDEEFKAAEKASKRRLELAKEEAAAKRKAADVDASPEQQAINAEQETLDIKKAQREAAKESQEIFDKHNASLVERLKYLREQLRLMDEAKKKERGQSFTGAAYDLDKINENLSGWGVSKSRRGTVNQDGMTASDIEQEISATEGRLGNRKEARRDHSAASSSGFGTSKWDHKRAADEKTASDVSGEYGSAISTVIGLLETIARAAGSAGNDKASSKGMGSLGVPYQLQPNSSF